MSDVRAIVRELRTLDNAVFERRLQATDVNERLKLRAEAHSIEARIERLQALIFIQASQSFDAEIQQLRNETISVRRTIEEIDDLNATLEGIAGALRIVDIVIGLFP